MGGCNNLVRRDAPNSKKNDQKNKEIVSCQAIKLVVCSISSRKVTSKGGPQIPKGLSPLPAKKTKAEKTCAVAKSVLCKARCSGLNALQQSQIFTSGGSCVQSVLECKGKELNKCLNGARCPQTVDIDIRKLIHKTCTPGCKGTKPNVCEEVALPY